MLIEYFDIIEKKIQYLIEVRSTLKIGDRNYEEHLKTINNNIHLLQVEQDNLFFFNLNKNNMAIIASNTGGSSYEPIAFRR